MFDYLDPVVTVTTPEEFAKEMRAIVARNTKTSSFCPEDGPTLDPEDCHWEHDRLMCKVLIELGYLEGVEVFNNTKKWYA